jgi:hypothetical protein
MIIDKAVEIPTSYCVEKPGAVKSKISLRSRMPGGVLWQLLPVKKKDKP